MMHVVDFMHIEGEKLNADCDEVSAIITHTRGIMAIWCQVSIGVPKLLLCSISSYHYEPSRAIVSQNLKISLFASAIYFIGGFSKQVQFPIIVSLMLLRSVGWEKQMEQGTK